MELNKIRNIFPNSTWLSKTTFDNAQYGTYKKFLILFTNIEINGNKVIATDEYLNEDNLLWIINNLEGITYLGDNKYQIDKKMFVPLKVIDKPKCVNVGDYFTSSNFRVTTTFKRIESFGKNPWSDSYNGLISNCMFCLYGFCNSYRGGKVFFIKNDYKLKKSLACGQITRV